MLHSLVAGLNSNRNLGNNRLNVHGDNWNDNNNGYVFGMALASKILKSKNPDVLFVLDFWMIQNLNEKTKNLWTWLKLAITFILKLLVWEI